MTLANAAIPTVMLIAPVMLVLIVPIIWIEAWLLRKLVEPQIAHPVRTAIAANAASTLVGLPLVTIGIWMAPTLPSQTPETFEQASLIEKFVWLLLEGMVIADFDPASPSKPWMFPVGLLLLHLVYFIASFATEWVVAKLMLDTKCRGVASAVFLGNLASYGMLLLGYVGLGVFVALM